MEAGVAAIAGDELLMLAIFDDDAILDRDDAVGAADRRKAMRDDDNGAALNDVAHVRLDDALGLVIEGGRRLIEDQDARIADKGAGDRDALPLAARQRHTTFANRRIVAARHLGNELMRAGKLGRLDDAFHR